MTQEELIQRGIRKEEATLMGLGLRRMQERELGCLAVSEDDPHVMAFAHNLLAMAEENGQKLEISEKSSTEAALRAAETDEVVAIVPSNICRYALAKMRCTGLVNSIKIPGAEIREGVS